MAYVVEIKTFGVWRPANLMYYPTLKQAEEQKEWMIRNELAGNRGLCRVRDTSRTKQSPWGMV